MEYVGDTLFIGGLESVCHELCVELPERLFALERLDLSSTNCVQVGDDLLPVIDEMAVFCLIVLIHIPRVGTKGEQVLLSESSMMARNKRYNVCKA